MKRIVSFVCVAWLLSIILVVVGGFAWFLYNSLNFETGILTFAFFFTIFSVAWLEKYL